LCPVSFIATEREIPARSRFLTAEPLGILQTYATLEQQAAEIREEFRRVGEMVKKAGLTK